MKETKHHFTYYRLTFNIVITCQKKNIHHPKLLI